MAKATFGKRIFAVALAGVLSVSFTACSGSGDGQAGDAKINIEPYSKMQFNTEKVQSGDIQSSLTLDLKPDGYSSKDYSIQQSDYKIEEVKVKEGDKGDKGDKGDRGEQGAAGKNGESAYESAVAGGYEGSKEQFYEDLATDENTYVDNETTISYNEKDDGTVTITAEKKEHNFDGENIITNDKEKVDIKVAGTDYVDNKVKEEAELRKEADVADAVYDAETGKLHLKNEASEDITVAEGIASKEAVEKNTSDIATNKENIEKNTQAITTERTERIQEVQRLDGRIDGLSNRIDELDGRIDKVGALAVAMAGLHPLEYDPDAPTQFSMAAGTYSGESAIAAGLFHNPNKDVLLSVGFSISGSEKAANVGATFRFGRSSESKARKVIEDKQREQELAAQAAAARQKTVSYRVEQILAEDTAKAE